MAEYLGGERWVYVCALPVQYVQASGPCLYVDTAALVFLMCIRSPCNPHSGKQLACPVWRWIAPTESCAACSCCLQSAKDEASHKAKKAADNTAAAADSAKHEARGFGAKLWGKSQVRMGNSSFVGGFAADLLHSLGAPAVRTCMHYICCCKTIVDACCKECVCMTFLLLLFCVPAGGC